MSTEESASVEIMPSMQLLAEAAQEQEKLPEREPKPDTDPELDVEPEGEEDDDRSSSLSELEDRAGTDGSDGSDAGTSAGGEEEDGLDVDHDDDGDGDDEEDDEHEHDPGAQLRDADELVREDDEEDDGNETEAETERLQESPEKKRPSRVVHLRAADALQPPTENADQTSEISALSDSEPDDASNTASLVGSPRKRKRADQESDDEDTTERSLKKVSRKLEDHVKEDEADRDNHDRIDEDKEEEDASDEERATSKDSTPEREEVPRPGGKDEDEVSVAEDAEAEGADGEAEAAAKSEEDAAKKEAALQELRSIEKDFALLRDRLFAEKSKMLNEELDVLRSNPTSHSEFSLASAAVARRRDEQKQLAMTIFEHSLRNLQKISLAERTMAHCQFMQEVRESREKTLDQAGHEWYRIQRERRRAEDDESEKRYHFNKDRALQVAAQQAYNREVSILSGIQKYVGFPAAPQLDGVDEADKADDLKKMGISARTIHNVPISAPISSFPRQQHLRADETFLDKNPWANPAQVYGTQAVNAAQQQQQQQQQQVNAGLFSTPAASRRQQAEPQTQDSTSTIAVSSVEQTPMSALGQAGSLPRPSALTTEGLSETPSRNALSRPELSITDASPVNGNNSKNGIIGGPGSSNGVSNLSISKSADDPSPRSSPLKATQVQTVSAGSS